MDFVPKVWRELANLSRERQAAKLSRQELVTLRSMQKPIVFGVILAALVVFGKVTAGHHPAAASNAIVAGEEFRSASSGGPVGNSAAIAPIGEDETLLFSPDSDLECAELAAVSRAKVTLDVAMYSFTDGALARRLAELAQHGVAVRVYRDASEYEREERSGRSTTALLRQSGVKVKIKAPGELMHLKSYAIDGKVLRSGSANWSRSGLQYQDNDLVYMNSASAAAGFEAEFSSIWNREDNLIVP